MGVSNQIQTQSQNQEGNKSANAGLGLWASTATGVVADAVQQQHAVTNVSLQDLLNRGIEVCYIPLHSTDADESRAFDPAREHVQVDLVTKEGRRLMFAQRLSAKGRGRASEATAGASERSSEPAMQVQTPPSDEAILGMPAREIFQYDVPGKKL